MGTSVAIGEFSRLTHLSVKTLRHYHEQGLLVPYAVDGASGYRRYALTQVPDALLIGRLRALDMPLADVQRVLASDDAAQRDAVVADHLRRMEAALDRTRAIVASLRGLLTAQAPAEAPEVRRVELPSLAAVTHTERVDRDGIEAWCARTFAGLYARLPRPPTGPAGALYAESFFTEAAGEVTAYVPVRSSHGGSVLPGGAYAVATHVGPYVDIDRTYAALGSWVAAYATGTPGPIRETYLSGPTDVTDPAHLRTDVCWPLA